MSLIPLKEIPKFIRSRIVVPADLPSKRELNLELIALIQDFFSNYKLKLEDQIVVDSYSNLPEWRVDTVLAKLRSLLELDAKNKIREFCLSLSKQRKDRISLLLRRAGIYGFRNSLELDLYVGVHTAISAYFKMMGVALVATKDCPITIVDSTRELFKILSFIATLPLQQLMAVDGLFWDSKLYMIPKTITNEISESTISYFVATSEIEGRLTSVLANEEHLGCPALRSRTTTGVAVFSLVEESCLDCVQRFYLDFGDPHQLPANTPPLKAG